MKDIEVICLRKAQKKMRYKNNLVPYETDGDCKMWHPKMCFYCEYSVLGESYSKTFADRQIGLVERRYQRRERDERKV